MQPHRGMARHMMARYTPEDAGRCPQVASLKKAREYNIVEQQPGGPT